MSFHHHTHPDQLETYSFLWSQARLVIAAVALFLGGVPPVYKLFGYAGFVWPWLNLSWIISGVASVYLLYRWNLSGKKIFGGKDQMDLGAFFVSVISGINLGLTGILKQNIGMNISSNKIIFILVGLLYLVTAWHLHKRWTESGRKLF